MDRCVGGRVNEWVHEQMNDCVGGYMNGWLDQWIREQTLHGWKQDEWVGGWK